MGETRQVNMKIAILIYGLFWRTVLGNLDTSRVQETSMPKLLRMLPPILILVLLLTVTISVGAQGNVTLDNLTVKPESPKENEDITISVDATNGGTAEETYTVTLLIDGENVDSKDITLAAGKTQTVSFKAKAGAIGQHSIELDGLTGQFETVEGAGGSFWSLFPTYVWGIIGAIVGVLILIVVVLTVLPSGKKRGANAGKAARRGQPSMSGTMPVPGHMSGTMPIPGPMPGPGHDMHQTGYPSTMPPHTSGPFPTQEQFQGPQTFPTPRPFQEPAPMGAPYPQYTRRPIFSLSNLTITPNHVKANEPVTITIMVSNNGAESGKYSVVLRINGVVENIIELLLSPGVSQAISFNVIKEIGGDYFAEVDGLGGEFTVVPLVPANFSVSDLVISPERVRQGESINISVIVTNNGEIGGDHSLVLNMKGAVESVQEVSLGPGESKRVDFNIIKNTPGFYNVELEGLTGRFVVEMEWQDTMKV